MLLYKNFALEELAISMAENGYFDEEPIVVVPSKLTTGVKNIFKIKEVEEKQKIFQEYARKSDAEFVVVEGNRRIATAKILCDDLLKSKLGADFASPKSENIRNDLVNIPAIVYPERKDVFPYLGVRHIIGIKKWGPFPKASYIAKRIENGEELNKIQEQVGDTTNSIKKQYFCYKILSIASDELGIDTKPIKNRFSLLMLSISQPSIRSFIGVPELRKINFNKTIVPLKKLDNLKLLLRWVFGDKDKPPLFTDSRKITSRLNPVLASAKATEYLIKYENIEEAYEFSSGEEEYLKKQLLQAINGLRNSLLYVYKYKDVEEVLELVKEVSELNEQVNKAIR